MDLLYILVISVVLAVDAFVVSISCGMSQPKMDIKFCTKVSALFGLAQSLFFGGGILFGFLIAAFFEKAGPWIAFILLTVVGTKLIVESLKGWKKPRECKLISTRTLIVLSIATSIDALGIGITFPLLEIPVIIPMIIVGAVTFTLSFIGVVIGDGLKGKFDKVAEIVAGLFLIGLGIKVFLDKFL
jgi:manganese efflux pump family protein